MPETPNRRARFARWCVRQAWSPRRWQRFALLVALVLATAALAMINVAARHQQADIPLTGLNLLDYVYAVFIYLVPQHSLLLADTLHWSEALVRVVGPLVPVIGVIWLVRRRVLVGLAEMALRHGARGHGVLLGDRGSADALALASAEAGEVVVLVDPSVVDEEDRLVRLGCAGVICRAQPPASLDRASNLAVWMPSDADNIARAIDLRGGGTTGNREIHLAVQSADLHRAMLHIPELMLDKAVRLRPHALACTAMRAMVTDAGLAELAIQRGYRQVTICLWGDSAALGWAAEVTLRQFWSIRLGPPRVIWADRVAPLPEALSHLSACARDVFTQEEQPLVEVVGAAEAVADARITCHLVDAVTTDATVAAGFALAARLRQIHADPPPVQPVLHGASAIAPLFAGDSLRFRPPIIPGAGLTLQSLVDRPQDREAARIHERYVKRFGDGGTAPASGRWQDLPETFVAANRAAADHRAIKLWDAETSGLNGEDLAEALARMEHNRWCAERLLAGWAPAGDGLRDDGRKLHPDLQPWDGLSEKARQKDRDAAADLLEAASR
ncbi:RyR domain-containing protein [Alteraurantiacibacter palmitatis]|uniref:RyR domain-containing protein n=1 Tax=Alteraurantiacibacter palmitatis TaxID=2054628 RepID=A0ABV7EAJ5_9SPHN